MANLAETNTWESGIYQFEEADVVQGGPAGIDNVPTRQLANRTVYLKARVDNADSGMTTHAAAADPHPNYWNNTRGDARIATHAAAADPHPAYWNNLRGDAKIAAALATLVNSSPATLDTLAELATALGNDANFAATMAALIAQKAPISSPVMTGSPSAPTPGQFNSSTSLATTEFVQRAIGNRSGDVVHLGSGNISPFSVGKTIVGSSASPFTLFLPALGAVSPGSEFEVINFNTGALTLQRVGTDVVYVGGLSLSSVVIPSGCSVRITSSNGAWSIPNNDAALNFSPLFGSSLGASGYQKLPSGLILQWGKIANTSRQVDGSSLGPISYPIAFPNAVLSVSAQMIGGEAVPLASLDGWVFVKTVGLSSFNLISGFSTTATYDYGAYWLAIGA